jgi:ABC-type Fe2+-enterobactin transport system substrate-binding protein
MNRNTGIIMAVTVPVISSEATQENPAGEKDFWAVYSRPEFRILSSMITE